MSCSKTLTLNPDSGDMGLDAAVYEPTTQAIFGVRGEWLFQFSSTTGALVQSMRFTHNTLSQSAITSMGGFLYISTYNSPILNTNGVSPFANGGDVFKVNAAAFSLVGGLSVASGIQPGFLTTYGFAAIANDGTNLAVLEKQFSRWNGDNQLLIFDPTNIPGKTSVWGGWVTDVTYDSFNSVFWGVEALAAQIFATNLASSCHNTTALNPVFGVCYNSAQNKAFAVDASEQFYEVDASTALPTFTNFAVTTRHTGRINANPFRIKSVNNQAGNVHNGKILIPCWQDDAVVIWNPSSNAVESTQTGFTAPIDVVVCPTTNWAVQTGSVGLTQIT